MSEPRTARRGEFWLAAGAIAATYAYFLLFAEFAFLELARQAVSGEPALRVVMGALGAGGIGGSLAALWRFRPEVFVGRLVLSYAACALAAVVALFVHGQVLLVLAAAGIGLALGWNTATLAAGLRLLLPADRLGLGCGVGTGAAYALCNVPAVFTAPAPVQARISVGLVALAALGLRGVRPGWRETPDPARPVVWPWVGVFLALVWLDSAAFYIIQHTPGLRHGTWEGETRLWGNAFLHVVAALVSGWLLDAGRLRTVTGAAWVALAVACLGLGTVGSVPATGALYAGGVSLYSAALVFFAARTGRPWVAAAVFAIAGWAGSALGIGMAQDLHGVPAGFVLASGAGLALALRPWRRTALVLVALLLPGRMSRAEEPGALVARGREVYVAEGCMHCHSQYVRPQVPADVERWGPARPLADLLRQSPPLAGNRRQGPDLSNVGNRRSTAWNRLHLQEPRRVSPGSRMPSYAHLFSPGDERGEALVAYLESLGADTWEERLATVQAWVPDRRVEPLSPEVAARLFRSQCAQCHGEQGRGDGLLAARLVPAPPDWTREPWRRAPGGEETLLARLIKFGAPGTAMPGHEPWSDAEILGLARHVKGLHTPASP